MMMGMIMRMRIVTKGVLEVTIGRSLPLWSCDNDDGDADGGDEDDDGDDYEDEDDDGDDYEDEDSHKESGGGDQLGGHYRCAAKRRRKIKKRNRCR